MSLGRTRQWDEALAATRGFIAAHPMGLWGARGYYWLGQLLTVVPHEGYQVGKRVYRGSDYPKVKTAEKPVDVYLGEEDVTKTIASFEEAKARYERLSPASARKRPTSTSISPPCSPAATSRSIVTALFELEKEKRPGLVLRWGKGDPKEVKALRGHDWTPTPKQPYRHAQPLPQRILGLYLQVETLDSGRAPQARLARASYLQGYQQAMADRMSGYDEKKKEWVRLAFPYQKLDPVALVESIADDFPRHALAPQAELLAGQWLEGSQQFLKAEAAYRDVVTRWPESKWVSDAQAHLQSLTWPSLESFRPLPAAGREALHRPRRPQREDYHLHRLSGAAGEAAAPPSRAGLAAPRNGPTSGPASAAPRNACGESRARRWPRGPT